uniref:LOW QUALITY PROTEIN: uncharacterized protein LOC105042719 n=1 Tax=Elaeis guineensis var. tenera TaxID=51953 RepID=A0A6J0PI68_ELAGV|nr:LOW QUALITY PROTEIN: uncharacterized protein LOC105042719 [Elaeis guineensis]
MATANASTSAAATALDPPAASAMEEAAAKAVHKRYEGLMTVRTKAIKGKGAWYWAHLEPILVQSSDTGLPKAVKLRCSLCDAVFSASNPSRTASEHLKRGTCPNFTSPSSAAAPALPSPPPQPISSIAPCSSIGHHHHNSRKRSSSAANPPPGSSYHHHLHSSSLALIDPSRFSSSSSPTAASAGGDVVVYPSSATPPPPHHLVLSGGKEDLGALAMLEDSVKKLKSPKTSPGPALSKAQVDSALSLLSDWFYESSGAVSLSSAEHPKFRSFLHHVGLPMLSRRDLAGPRLDARFEEARADADARIRDALFFQLSSDGWRPRDAASSSSSDALVSLSVNLPNGTSVFHRAVLTHGGAPSKYAEEVLWDTVADVCGSSVQRCAGIVTDRFKSTALRNLENQHNWMVNLYCQLQGFYNLIKDFARELPLFHSVVFNCCKLATFFNTKNQARGIFHKYQLQELDHTFLLCVPPSFNSSADRVSHSREIVRDFVPVFAMLEDIVASSRALQLAVHDESYKLVCLEDSIARELGEMIRDMGFWGDLNAVCSLVKLVKEMAQEMEAERPLVGQCLPLWNELRAKVKDWCNKFSIEDGPVKKVVEKRFEKNYHPAWSAAFILDPLYLIKDSSGKYLPPFKCLTPDQEKDVDRLITRMVSREEAHIALMELMKWRAEGLDPLYAQAVQVKKPDPVTGKMKIANPQSSRLVWETHLSEFKSLGKVAVRLIFLHATSCGYKCNLSLLRWVCMHGRSRAGMDRAQKLVFVAAHAKLERRDFSNEEEKDAELFDDGEDYMLHESAFVDA